MSLSGADQSRKADFALKIVHKWSIFPHADRETLLYDRGSKLALQVRTDGGEMPPNYVDGRRKNIRPQKVDSEYKYSTYTAPS